MKITDIDNNVRFTDMENFFNVYEDERGNYVYNLNSSVYLNVEQMNTYTLKTNAHWPLISYLIYGTTHLYWILMKINNVDGNHIFDIQKAGTNILYVDKNYMNNILAQL